MKTSIGLGVVAVMMGCGMSDLETSAGEQEIRGSCPDETCPLSNGGGVYTEELGIATVGGAHQMIRNFINAGGQSDVYLRAWDDLNQSWQIVTPELVGVYLDDNYNIPYQLVSVDEQLSLPTFTLKHGFAAPFPVTGEQLVTRHLTLAYKDAGYFAIGFAASTTEQGTDTPLHQYYLVWSPDLHLDYATAQPYCQRAKNPAGTREVDPVMFQQGIQVNVATADTAINADSVTVSCRHGAIASAKAWGYKYRGTVGDVRMFEAAMHMKRASYCGDDSFYTRRGVLIRVADTAGFQHGSLDAGFEATWGWDQIHGSHALCVNMNALRRPNANYPPDSTGTPFNGTCSWGPLPDCGTSFGALADEFDHYDPSI